MSAQTWIIPNQKKNSKICLTIQQFVHKFPTLICDVNITNAVIGVHLRQCPGNFGGSFIAQWL